MSESLDMLQTEEGQLNAVFACFGSVAQHAQMFEEALGNFLLAYNNVRPEKMSAQELEELTQNMQGRTMGQLLYELKSRVTFNAGDYRERMEAALKARNYLMHKWFLEGCIPVLRSHFCRVFEGFCQVAIAGSDFALMFCGSQRQSV
jgi:hypothetical protein